MTEQEHSGRARASGLHRNREQASRLALATVLCMTLVACELPDPPDVRAEWSSRIQQLGGLTAVYPPQEGIRVGQLWAVDASAAADQKHSGVKPRHVSVMRVSDALVEPMEKRRMAQPSVAQRFEPSPASLKTDLALTAGSYFRQPANDRLMLAAMPRYSLMSLNQGSLNASAPTAFASFLAAAGFSNTKELTVAPLGVEIADLADDDFGTVLANGCMAPGGTFAAGPGRDRAQARA